MKQRERGAEDGPPPQEQRPSLVLRLYISGNTPSSMRAILNIRAFCERHRPGAYELEIRDAVKEPAMAVHDQIIALPTLLMIRPVPGKRFIGDMSNIERLTALVN